MIGKYKPYPEYKDSEIEWLGAVPAHWKICRVKNVATINPSKSEVRGLPADSQVSFIPMDAIGEKGELDASRVKTLSEVLTGYTYIADGDIMIAKITPCFENGKGAIAKNLFNGIGFATTEVIPIRPERPVDANFLFYVLNCNPFKFIAESSMYGAGGQKRVADSFVAEYHLSIPSESERVKIANFLDHETTKIDTLIEKQQQLIQLLKEKRQAVISHAVCVHEDEVAVKISHLIDLLPGYAFPSSGFQGEADQNVKLLRGVNVSVGSLRWDDVVYWPAKYLSDLEQFQLVEKDIVFGMDRPWISSGTRIAEIKKEDLPCMLLQRVARIRANNRAYQGFIKLCLQSNEFKAYVESDLTGVSVPHISPDQIKCFLVRHLNYAQQKSITDNAELKLEQLNLIVDRASYSIELMQERRAALISAVVTGKIDVRNWVASKANQTNKEVAA